MRIQKKVRKSKLLSCAEEKPMLTWPQQVHDDPDGVLCVSERQVSCAKFIRTFHLPNTVQKIRADELKSSVENGCAIVRAAGNYQITASAALQSEIRLTRSQQGFHTRLKRDQRTAGVLPASVLWENHRSEAGVRARNGVGGTLLCRSRQSKMVGSLICILLPVRTEPCEKAR